MLRGKALKKPSLLCRLDLTSCDFPHNKKIKKKMPLAILLQFISYAHLSIALYVKVSKDQYF